MLAVGCGAKDQGNGFNPRNPFGAGPAAISLSTSGGELVPSDLGSAGGYVILSKTGISDVTGSAVSGNIGVSPAASTYITGFALSADATNVFSTSSKVVGGGKVYAATYAAPTPSNLTTAIGNMETAYTDAAGRSNPDFNELSSGEIGSLTLAPGLYKWTNTVSISNDVTISGSATDIWIFQISGDITMASGKNVILTGGALPKNVFWQVAGQVTIGTNAHFEGIILSKTAINFQTGASLEGRAYAQSAVTLDFNNIVQP